jgi:hypothetical protein
MRQPYKVHELGELVSLVQADFPGN